MATSPEFVRVVLGTARTFSDIALDTLREAVLLIDTRLHHKPVLLANAAARRFFVGPADAAPLLDSCLYEWLRVSEAEAVEATLAALTRQQAAVSRIVAWRSLAGEIPVMTDFRLVDGAAGQRVVMLSFAATAAKPELLFAIDKLPMELLILDRNLKITYANAAALRAPQFGATKLLGGSALTVRPTAALSIHVYRHALAGTAYQGDPVGFLRLGESVWYEMRVQPLMSGARVVGLLVVSMDVTKRHLQVRAQAASERRLRALSEHANDVIAAHRQSEIRLRRSEELLRATTENTADTLILLDADLHIRFANKALHGMTIEQMADVEIGRLLPAEPRDRVSAKLRHVLLSGEAVSYEYEDAGTARETRYFDNRAVLVQGQGVGTGISLSVRDITERKRLEQEILEVSGRERQRIGRDLHDGLGQELTGIALMLRGLARRLEREAPEAMESVNEIVGLINRSIDSTRCLARGLLPVSIEQGGLLEALHSLADRSRGLYGLEVQFP